MQFNGFFISRSFSILRNISLSANHVNANIKALVQQGRYQEALESYSKDPNFPLCTSRFTFPSLLKACASLSSFHYGGTLQSTIIKMGLSFDPYIINSLIRMYVKCGSLCSAVKLFDNVSQCEVSGEDVALWNSIIDGHSKYGFFEEGLVQFRRMQVLSVKPDGYTLCILLGMCNDFLGISCGKEIHGYVVRNMFDEDLFLITAMIDVYSSSSRPMDAWNVFEKLENKYNIAVWNSMINGFCENGLWRNGLKLYPLAKSEGLELVSTTFSSVLTACSQGEDIEFGCQLHCDAVKTGFESDPYVSTSLLTFYSKCGFVEDAERVFYLVRDREVGLWNSMISAYVNCGFANDALGIYTEMRRRQVAPDSFTISNALVACSMIGSFYSGTMIHGELIKRPLNDNLAAPSALLTMYSRLGSLEDAYRVFIQMKEKDVVAWGSMISGSCENKKFNKALELYKTMESDGVKPDANVIATGIIACVGLREGKLGGCFHGLAIKEGVDLDSFIGSTLIEFYSKCGQPDMARNAFSSVLQKNLVVWNSLISCYSQNGLPDVSVALLPQILQDGLYPDSVSITTVLAAVSQMAALLKGKTIHGYHIRFQLPSEIQVENALLDMYIKCGCFTYAQRVFYSMSNRDVVAWNSMMAGYGSHGECHKAINLFHEMRNSGIAPDEITFLSLIYSCNHCGFIDEGLNLFQLMKEHSIEPKMEHYINIVDLLGRAGRLNDACGFIENMVIAPDRGIWLSLLSACRVHRNVELGELAADNLFKMEPTRGSNYIQLLNLYVEAGLKEQAANLRTMMRQKGLTKLPGCSWIEVKNKVDVFFSGDSSSPRTVKIYETLDSLRNSMKRKECHCEAGETIYEPG
ncbi:pentatricopeptide repeat-containing protein At2g40720 [Sesamum indicum]|uniref:Pentatricopeptide repeat-containing protein At2g40720 n=1 Tax=Sesamum indicum TaxID=4182 RepID=A0A6I9TKK4_SESIN|nr:pentatricopeptide repeat-containing protein At2g40720 [Sesamum indicum]